jgi:hypothetical protein
MIPELIKINEDDLFDYLVKKELPVMEFDILKHIMPVQSDDTGQYTLFVKHFSLYHALYKLKFRSGVKGYYLHLDCMRIRLIPIPEKGRCRHYDAEKGNFCGEQATSDYCIAHRTGYKHYRNSVSFDILQDFYTDAGNITFGDSELLKKLVSGISVYSFKKKDIDEALRFFDIHKPGKRIIINRYRELAVKYHPDKCGGSGEMMKKVNSAYMILKEVFIL